jgi:TRAP-type C4-dicarboxylate transport system substrate-binding protein
MRKLTLMFIVVAFLTGGIFVGSVGAQTVTLKAVTAWPKTSTEFKAFTFFQESLDRVVAQKAPGQLKIQFIGGPEAVKTNDQVEALQRGMVDIVFTTNAYYVSLFSGTNERGLGIYKRPSQDERPLLSRKTRHPDSFPSVSQEAHSDG